jgi:hypothetical protein
MYRSFSLRGERQIESALEFKILKGCVVCEFLCSFYDNLCSAVFSKWEKLINNFHCTCPVNYGKLKMTAVYKLRQ